VTPDGKECSFRGTYLEVEHDGKVRKQPCFIHPADEGARRRKPRRGQSKVD